MRPERLPLVNVYPTSAGANYLLSSYVLKAYLDQVSDKGQVQVLNFPEDAEADEICQAILDTEPACVGYSCYIWNIEHILEVVRSLAGRLDAVTIFGGPEVSHSRSRDLMGPDGADYCIVGEGERKLATLIRALESGTDASAAPGVIARSRGLEARCEDTEILAELDEIPSVYVSGAIESKLYARKQAFIETQRGCRYRCRYCVYHKNAPSVRYYSLPRVFEELDHLILEKRVSALRVLDPVFPSDLARAKAIVRHLAGMKARGVRRLPWVYWEFTHRNVDDEFLALLAELKTQPEILNTEDALPLDQPQLYSHLVNGYTAINCVGVQSLNAEALEAVRRAPVEPDEFGAFMEAVRRHNLVLKLDLILGLPFETFDSYFEGLDFLLPYFRNTDHILNVHRLQILPGSELEGLCEDYGIEYPKTAPHTVSATATFPRDELTRASRLTGVLFRAVNSPLRSRFFEAFQRSGGHALSVAESVLEAMRSSEALRETGLVRRDDVDDGYWNDAVFREIPSDWLASTLATIKD